METKDWLKIGELGRRSGMTVDALRYYEERGILPPARRTTGGFRMFPPSSLERLRFVDRAQRLGFSLEEILELFNLRQSEASDSLRVRGLVEGHIQAIDQKVAQLLEIRQALEGLAERCDGSHPTSQCPILEYFSASEPKECCHAVA